MLKFAFLIVLLFLNGKGKAQESIEVPVSTNTVFVRFTRDMTVNEANQKLAPTNMAVTYKSYLVPGLFIAKPNVPNFNAQASRRAFRIVSEISYVEDDRPYRRVLAPMKPLFSAYSVPSKGENRSGLPKDDMVTKQWALVGAAGLNPAAGWKYSVGDRRVIVAIMDTGIDATHPELSDRVLKGYDFINNTAQVVDRHGHGTHVSGIIGARWDNQGIAGLNRDVSLLPVKVVPENGDETDENVVKGFEYAVSRQARVANCSFGKKRTTRAVGEVITAAEKFGLLVVVAAGNGGEDGRGDNLNEIPDFPAFFETSNMIVVASSNIRGTKSGFSNFGLGHVDVAAPGENILSTLPGGQYASWSGTSMATPQVVGVAALLIAANPKLTPNQIKQIIMKTVRKSNSWGGYVTSAGIVDLSAAMALAVQSRN